MLLESNTNYLTKVGVWTTPTPKFTKSTIKTVYKLRQWMFDEAVRINTMLSDNTVKLNLNCEYKFNLILLAAFPKNPKNYSSADIQTLSIMLLII